jgi:hypothetical protein
MITKFQEYINENVENTITIQGKIVFDPEDKTKKHILQSSWKKMAMVLLDGDWCNYYAWFIEKRYNLKLNKPLRNAHVSFINDSYKDMIGDSEQEKEEKWRKVKEKWDGKIIDITLDLGFKTDGEHWWLRVSPEHRQIFDEIRTEIGLGRPYWGLHMTIGYANNKNIEHSKYIHELIKKGFIS